MPLRQIKLLCRESAGMDVLNSRRVAKRVRLRAGERRARITKVRLDSLSAGWALAQTSAVLEPNGGVRSDGFPCSMRMISLSAQAAGILMI